MTRLDQKTSEDVEDGGPKPLPKPSFTTAAQYAKSRVADGVTGTPLRNDGDSEDKKEPESEQEFVREVLGAPPSEMKSPDLHLGEEPKEEPPEKEEVKGSVEELTQDEKLDMLASSNIVSHKHMVSDARRKAVEATLEPMDIGDLVTSDGVRQKVESVPGKIAYVFRSLSHAETLFCYKYVGKEQGSIAFGEEMMNTCKLVCMAAALNGSHFAPHMDEKGEIDEELFNAKFKQLAKLPSPLISDMSVQATWFSDRVTKLFTFDNLKNG